MGGRAGRKAHRPAISKSVTVALPLMCSLLSFAMPFLLHATAQTQSNFASGRAQFVAFIRDAPGPDLTNISFGP